MVQVRIMHKVYLFYGTSTNDISCILLDANFINFHLKINKFLQLSSIYNFDLTISWLQTK